MSSSPVLELHAATAVVALAAPSTLRKERRLVTALGSLVGEARSLMRET